MLPEPIRNAIDVPIEKDLYHFFRRNEPLSDCLTTLDDRLDPERRYRNFAFVAAPLHLIEAPTVGSGKSLLCQLISVIATGKGLDALRAYALLGEPGSDYRDRIDHALDRLGLGPLADRKVVGERKSIARPPAASVSPRSSRLIGSAVRALR